MTDKHAKGHVPPPPLRPWQQVSFSFKKTKHHKTAEDKIIEEGLEAIYLKDRRDLTKFEGRQSRLTWRLLVTVLVGLFGLSSLAWVGLTVFKPFVNPTGPGLALEIAGPTSVSLGQEETYVVRWSNRSSVAVSEVLVRINVPPELSLTYVDPPPSDAQARQWNLGLVSPGQEGRLTLKGVFLGEIGETSAIQAVGTYREPDSNEISEAIAALPVSYDRSLLEGELRLPAKVVSGEIFEIVYIITNNAPQTSEGLLARLHLPAGFIPTATSSATFTLIDESYEIGLPSLPANSSSTIRLTGSFVSGSSGDQALDARIGLRRSRDRFVVLHADAKTLPVLAGDLSLRLIANGSSENRLLTPGDPLRLSLAYENVSPESISGVSLTLKFESFKDGVSATGTSWLDWSRLEDRNDGAISTDGRLQSLRFDSQNVPALANIPPQGKGTFEISLPTLQVATSTRDARIVLSYEGRILKVGKDVVNRALSTAPIELRYRSDVQLTSSAIYYTEEGAPVGSGPLPPQAGKTTSYRIVWTVSKSLHELTGVSVSAVLPPIVAWGDQSLVGAGEVTYDEATRTVRWSLNKLPNEVQDLDASFEVQVTPSNLDIGRFAAVLGEAKLEALDADTGESILKSKPPLTTDLQNDEWAKRKGVVRKP